MTDISREKLEVAIDAERDALCRLYEAHAYGIKKFASRLKIFMRDGELDADPWIPVSTPPESIELNEITRNILGRPNFACRPLAQFLRSQGHEIKTKAEDEQAAAIHYMLNLYLEHKENWNDEFRKILDAAAPIKE